MSGDATADLIDRIYECSVAPELWPSVLDDLASVAEARGGLVFASRKAVCWTASDSVTELFDEYFRDGWFGRCSRRVCSAAAGKASFFVEEDFWTPEQLNDDPMYRDLFRAHGVGWSAWTGMRLPTGDEIVVSLERPFDRGPIERELVDRLNVIRPHLVRAALVSARLGLQRVKGATEALAALGLPALLIDETGRVMEASPMAENSWRPGPLWTRRPAGPARSARGRPTCGGLGRDRDDARRGIQHLLGPRRGGTAGRGAAYDAAAPVGL